MKLISKRVKLAQSKFARKKVIKIMYEKTEKNALVGVTRLIMERKFARKPFFKPPATRSNAWLITIMFSLLSALNRYQGDFFLTPV